MNALLDLARECRRRWLNICHLLCLLELAEHGEEFVTVYQLEDATGYSLTHVNHALRLLEEEGLVSFQRGTRGSSANHQRTPSRAKLSRAGREFLAGVI